MKLIGLEEHWCPRELFDTEGTPGYESMMSVIAFTFLRSYLLIGLSTPITYRIFYRFGQARTCGGAVFTL